MKKTYEIVSFLPPTIFTSPIDGRKYIVPQWIEVPLDTTRDQIIHKRMEFDREIILMTIKSTRSATEYKISKKGDLIKCSCSGYKFRGTCKHYKEYLETVKK